MENAARISRSLNTLQEHTIMSRLLHLSHETMLHRSLNLIPIKKGEAVYLTGIDANDKVARASARSRFRELTAR
jgi:hypothetical protein